MTRAVDSISIMKTNFPTHISVRHESVYRTLRRKRHGPVHRDCWYAISFEDTVVGKFVYGISVAELL